MLVGSAVGLAGLVTAASPAGAATSSVICVSVNGQRTCIDVPFAIDPQYLHCAGCPTIDLDHDPLVLPADQRIAATLARGLGELLRARAVADPTEHAQALAEIRQASALAEPNPLRASNPNPQPWVPVASDLARTSVLYQRVDATTDPARAATLRRNAAAEADTTAALIESYAVR